MVPFRSNDIAICETGWIKYAQYVKRLSGSIARSDSNPLIGFANPHLHDKTIQTSANPHADDSVHMKKSEKNRFINFIKLNFLWIFKNSLIERAYSPYLFMLILGNESSSYKLSKFKFTTIVWTNWCLKQSI